MSGGPRPRQSNHHMACISQLSSKATCCPGSRQLQVLAIHAGPCTTRVTHAHNVPTYQLFPRSNQQHTVVAASASASSSNSSPLVEGSVARTDVSPNDAASRQFALACAEVADETKCQDVTVLHVAPHVSWTSYMVIATVSSRPQLLAAIARIERMVEDEHAASRTHQNQPGASPWECLDYGDVIVHLMTAEQRDVYDLEGFYAAAEEVDLPWALPAPGSGKPTWTKQY